jgi:hypothetical protein
MSHPVSVIATFTPALCKALNDRTLDVAIVRPAGAGRARSYDPAFSNKRRYPPDMDLAPNL